MKSLISCLFVLLLLTACQTDSYESGDTKYSYLRTDFAEAHSSAEGLLDRCVTDEDATLFFSPQAEAKWAGTADSVYRTLVYYDVRDLDTINLSGKTVVPLAAIRVPVLMPKDVTELEGVVKTDPLMLESSWVSTNGRYLNLGIVYKTGKADDEEAVQTISLLKESEHEDTVTLCLLHDQGGVPEYYSSRIYTSIPLFNELAGKTIRLRVNTYKGEVEKIY
ncbi:MAG: hypothetical protein IJS97_02030 [Prevotella sp.]|nr:hypothetical protein [Prevotella sp.]